MAFATLTELNQRPSHIARLAESEPVHIQKYGRPFLVLQRESDPVEDLRAAGLIRAPIDKFPDTFPNLGVTSDHAEVIYDEFLAERQS
jgi:hypothetical protein